MKLDKWDIEILESVGLDHTEFNDSQLAHLLQPCHAPENYYMDGEITPSQADHIWIERLRKLGVYGDNLAKALKIIR